MPAAINKQANGIKEKAVMNQQVITAFILFIFPVGVFSS